MRYLIRFYQNKSFHNILKTLSMLALLIVLACCGHYVLPGPGHAALKGNGLAPVDQSYIHPVSFLNDRARDITGAAAVNAPAFVVPGGLTGEGQIVAVADSGLDAGSTDDIHPDLKSAPGKMPKVVLLKSWADRKVPDDPDGHGTHMAAAIAGTGAASNGKFRGIAPGASIYFQAILDSKGSPAPPANLADLFFPPYSAGARVHVNGWGGGPDIYGESAAQVDDFVRNHPDFLVIFGAGNSGPSAGTITGEANSKNALAVGASTLPRPAFTPGAGDTTATAEFSSRGPAGDGRIKPELLAPASDVISARSRLVEGNLPGYQEYTRMQGTSMAAAVAGGSSALMREYLKKYMDMATPSAALVKAVLINGARTAADGPSKDGFGIIDLAGTVIALKESTFSLADEWAGVSQGEEVAYTFQVSDRSAPFKATLAWTDPPAEPGSGKTLVNDLDLMVKTPDGRVYYGNHFAGGNTHDRVNNVEQVYLPSPAPGVYTVTISGASVRRNTVQGSGAFLQDFALVWGQKPAEDSVERADGGTVKLAGGASVNTAGTQVVNLLDDALAPADNDHILPGAEAYRTPGRLYLVSRLWRAAGVKALQTADGTVFTEINTAARLGGYALAGDAGEIVLNGSPAGPGELPPGLEINAVVNPLDQKIRQVRTSYTEHEGVVSAVRNNGGQKEIILAGTGKAFRVSRDAVCSYEDNYTGIETTDMPFGTGALDELEEVLPGMPVRLRLAPSSGEVQYLAVKRWVALGEVRDINYAGGEIKMENGDSFKILPGARVVRNREISGLDQVQPGDHVAAVILPDTGEAIGLVAFSDIIYGKVIEYTKKSRTIYLLDDDGCYRSLYLPHDAVVYRWGVGASTDTITTGSRVRVIADAEGGEAWRLDIADTFFDKGVLETYDKASGVVTLESDRQYRLSSSTRFYKNGCPVLPEDLLPGEQVELEYASAPPPTGNVLLTVSARSGAYPPLLLASAVPLRDRLVVAGRTGADTDVYIWEKNGSRQAVAVDTDGKFNFSLPPVRGEAYSFTLTAVNHRTKGVTGRTVSLPGNSGSVSGAAVSRGAAGVTGQERAALTRVEAVTALARLLNWPRVSERDLPFKDAEDIPVASRPDVAEAMARGIVKGYPGGSFHPVAALTRAEAAVVLAAVLQDLGLESETSLALPYTDAGDIPSWAAGAVSQVTAAGLFESRENGTFEPLEPVTAGEMGLLLDRLLAYCARVWAK